MIRAGKSVVVALLASLALFGTARAAPVDEALRLDAAYELEQKQNFDEAAAAFEALAEEGSAEAHHHLGFLYSDGLGLARDLGKAAAHWRAGADLGHDDSLIALVYLYGTRDDPHFPPDPVAAARTVLELSHRDLPAAGDLIGFWSRPVRRAVQRGLAAAGFYRGAIDGLIGDGSRRALERYGSTLRAPVPPASVFLDDTPVFVAPGRIGDQPLAGLSLPEIRDLAPFLALRQSGVELAAGIDLALNGSTTALARLSGDDFQILTLFPQGPAPVRLAANAPFASFADLAGLGACQFEPQEQNSAETDAQTRTSGLVCPLAGGRLALAFSPDGDGKPEFFRALVFLAP